MTRARQAAAPPPLFAPFGPPPAAAQSIRTVLGKALDYQGHAVRQAITGESDTNKQMAKIRYAIPGVEPFYNWLGRKNPAVGPNLGPLEAPVQGAAHALNHAAQGLIDAAIAQPLDPLTWETLFAGPLVKGALPVLAKGAEATAVTRSISRALQTGATRAKAVAGKANTYFDWSAPAAQSGFDPAVVRGAAQQASFEGSHLQQRIMERVNNILNGVPIKTVQGQIRPGTRFGDAEKFRIAQALHGEGLEVPLSPREQTAYRQLRALTNLDYQLRRNAARTVLRHNNPGLSQADEEAMLDKTVPHREDYLPASHQGQQGGREGFTANPTRYYDPRTLHQKDFYVQGPEDLERGFQAMASNLGRQRTTQVLHETLGNVLDDPRVNKMFDEFVPPTGDKRALKDYIREAWLGTIGYPRAATVSFTPRHSFNIADLAINTVPPEKQGQLTAEVSGLIPKLMTASPREYAALIQEYGGESAVGGGFAEKKPFMQNFASTFPNWMPKIGGKNVPLIGGKSIPIISKWSYLNNKLVWATDAAFKMVYSKIMKQTGEVAGALGKLPEGMAPQEAANLRAGGLSSQRLVDYEHLSPFQKQLRYIAPFGTFRGGIPSAVIGGIARNPARAAFFNRATGGAMYGDRPETSGDPGLQMNNPTADIGRLFDWNQRTTAGGKSYPVSGPAEFTEATLGNVPSAALGVAADVMFPDKLPISQNPLAYGQTWLPHRDASGKLDLGFIASQALGGIPEASAFLQAMGISRFKWKGLAHELIRQSTGLQYTPAASP